MDDNEVRIDIVEDEVLGVMFRADELPLKKEIVLEDGRTGSVEVDQTAFTFTVGNESKVLTSNELMDLLKFIENHGKSDDEFRRTQKKIY